jgi:hypothetical protein
MAYIPLATKVDFVDTVAAADVNTLNNNIEYIKDLIDDKVSLTGDETIAGVKTFSSFPVTPESDPTTDYQAANKKYVDDKISPVIKTAFITGTSLEVKQYTIPETGTYELQIQASGGKGSTRTSDFLGAGGGSGVFAILTKEFTKDTVLTVTIGSTVATTQTFTSVSDGTTTWTCENGRAVANNTNVGGLGGTVVSGAGLKIVKPGEDGGVGTTVGSAPALHQGGKGGDSFWGTGGIQPSNSAGQNGISGWGYGSGGQGATRTGTNRNGGDGAPGCLWVRPLEVI